MDEFTCDSCFKDNRSINEKLNETIEKAQTYANKNRQAVVVYPTPGDFEFMEEKAYPPGNSFTVRVTPGDLTNNGTAI